MLVVQEILTLPSTLTTWNFTLWKHWSSWSSTNKSQDPITGILYMFVCHSFCLAVALCTQGHYIVSCICWLALQFYFSTCQSWLWEAWFSCHRVSPCSANWLLSVVCHNFFDQLAVSWSASVHKKNLCFYSHLYLLVYTRNLLHSTFHLIVGIPLGFFDFSCMYFLVSFWNINE